MSVRRLFAAVMVGACLSGWMFACRGRADEPKVSEEMTRKIEAALPDKAPAKPQKPRKVLVFTLAKGFVHSSIPVGAKAIEMLGKKTGAYDSVISNDIEMFDPEKLKDFDAVVM